MGVGHSGSTFLQMLLSAHEQMVGLGEISLLIKNMHENNISPSKMPDCSCGAKAVDCEMWGDFLASSENGNDDIQTFEKIINRFKVKFPNKILVDSSKNLQSFKKYYKEISSLDVEVSVILLVRDFRSWVISREKNNKRKHRKDYGLVYNAHKWYYRNRRKLKFLHKNNFPYTVISYEDLVLQKEKSLKKITELLNITNQFTDLKNAEMHDIYGNRMKNDPSKSKQFFYDNKWMKNNKTVFLSPFLMLPYSLNRKLYNL